MDQSPSSLPSLPGIDAAFVPDTSARRPASRRWIVGVIAVVVLLALGGIVVARGASHRATTSAVGGAPTRPSHQASLASEGVRFQAAENVLSAQTLPYARTFTSDVNAAANTIITDEVQIARIERATAAASVASLSPTSLQIEAELQCVYLAAGESVSQMMATFQQCTQPEVNAADAPLAREVQIGYSMLALAITDLQNPDAAMISLSGSCSMRGRLPASCPCGRR
jgi:hypothetical protein